MTLTRGLDLPLGRLQGLDMRQAGGRGGHDACTDLQALSVGQPLPGVLLMVELRRRVEVEAQDALPGQGHGVKGAGLDAARGDPAREVPEGLAADEGDAPEGVPQPAAHLGGRAVHLPEVVAAFLCRGVREAGENTLGKNRLATLPLLRTSWEGFRASDVVGAQRGRRRGRPRGAIGSGVFLMFLFLFLFVCFLVFLLSLISLFSLVSCFSLLSRYYPPSPTYSSHSTYSSPCVYHYSCFVSCSAPLSSTSFSSSSVVPRIYNLHVPLPCIAFLLFFVLMVFRHFRFS